MKKHTILILTLLLSVMPYLLVGQKIINKDTRISKALSLVQAENLTITVSDLVSKNTRHNLSTRNNPSKGIGAAAEYLIQRLKSYKTGASHMSVLKYDYNAGGEGTRLGREVTLSNIVADFKGTNNADDRVIILLAHYDSRSFDNSDSTAFAPGANDNGSGVSALLEIARILSETPLPVSVKLMFLSGEEHGLLGAAHMASEAKKGNWNIEAVLNNDMIGNSRSSGTEISGNTRLRVFSENIPFSETPAKKRIREFNSGENDSESRQLARYIKEISERYVENLEISLIYRNDRFGRGGDHTPFSREGFTSIRLCEYYENYDRTHQIPETREGKEYGDLISGVDFEYVRKNTMANLSSLMNLAFAPQKPLNAIIDISGLSSSTKISWQPPKGGDTPVGYYILIRETDKSNWEKKIFVSGTSADLPFSKDNHFFAVQSVNSNGNESLPVFAVGGSAK
jgi:hypothetical protein